MPRSIVCGQKWLKAEAPPCELAVELFIRCANTASVGYMQQDHLLGKKPVRNYLQCAAAHSARQATNAVM